MPAVLLLGSAVGMMAASAPPHPSLGECASEHGSVTLCIYRSLIPSAGIVTSCRDHTCRVGHYYGNPADAVWFTPPPEMASFPTPEVIWLTATLAQVRFACARPCTVSYFFEVIRHRVSEPRFSVLAVDTRRLLMAAAEARALVVRQIFSGCEIVRLEREWAPAAWLGDVIPSLHFDPDGRLTFTWLRGQERSPVSERISVPSFPRS